MPLPFLRPVITTHLPPFHRSLGFSGRTMSSSSRFHLPRKSTALFLCDIQEKFTSVYEFESVVETAKKMVAAGKELGVPLVATEQNPTRLGSTVREIDISEAKIVVPKT